MPQTITIVFASSRADAAWAANYHQSHSQSKVKIFPTDTPALLYLLKYYPRLINRLDAYIKPSPRLQSLIGLPLTLAQRITRTNPQWQLLVEVFRSEFTQVLSQYYILYQASQNTGCKKIIASPGSFKPQTLRQFTHDFNLDYGLIPSTKIFSLHQFWLKLTVFISPLTWFLNHPKELFIFLHYLFSPQATSKANILVFSNGLNLASYHSTIKSLLKKLSVNIITDRQGFKDKLYLAKYGLNGSQLPKNLSHPAINTQIKISTLPPVPWFISTSSLKRLIYAAALRVIKRSGQKTLSKFTAAQRLIKQSRPKLVITTHDPGPSGLSFVAAAKAQKIKTLVLVHGAPSRVHYFYSDTQLIWGKLMQRLLVKAGTSPRRLKLGGHPIYWNYHQYFDLLNHTPQPPIIGMITTGTGQHEWHQALYFWDLFQALKSFKHCRIMVRTHGMQHLNSLIQLAHHFDLDISFNPPLHLEEFVAQSKVIIAQNSTAALVPLIAHKPTILLDPWFPFLDAGLISLSPAFFKPKTNKQLIRLIKTFIAHQPSSTYSKVQDRYIREFCGPLNAKVGEIIAEKILEEI